MKKLFYLFFAFLLVLNAPLKEPYFLKALNKNKAATYSFYVTDKNLQDNNIYVIDNAGLGSIVRCEARNAKSVKNKLTNIMGESVSFAADFNEVMQYVNVFHASIMKTEWIDGVIFNIYAYSNAFNRCVFLENEAINLQICYNQGVLTLGTPVILGDY